MEKTPTITTYLAKKAREKRGQDEADTGETSRWTTIKISKKNYRATQKWFGLQWVQRVRVPYFFEETKNK